MRRWLKTAQDPLNPSDYDPAQDRMRPTWDPSALTQEEREELKVMLRKMIDKT
jgi:hypothetical protein